MSPLLQVSDLAVEFESPEGPVRVLRGVDLVLRPGEILGLVGESGSGKSVTCLSLLRLAGPQARISGRVLYDGRDLLTLDAGEIEGLRGREISMIFQDPAAALNPVVTVGRQVEEAVRLNRPEIGASGRGALRAEAIRLLQEVGIPRPEIRYGRYPHELSGGQNQRVMIAMMLAGSPRLLIADEPTTALDVTIQAQILALLVALSRSRGTALVLITHDLGVVAQTCQRVAVMYGGRIVEAGPVTDVFATPQHPYTAGLLQSRPRFDQEGGALRAIEGTVPGPGQMPLGCAFAPRCPQALGACRKEVPKLCASDSHSYACFNPVSELGLRLPA